MKKNLFTGFTGISLLLVVCIAASGQVASTGMQSSKDVGSIEKPTSGRIEASKVSQKAVRDLTKSFKNASDEKWFSLQDGFVAMFNQDGIDLQVAYDKRGNWLYAIRKYDETKMSSDLRHTVKSTYYDYSITQVQEIEKPRNTLTYIVHLEGKTDYINLKVSDGEMEEWQKFNKSE